MIAARGFPFFKPDSQGKWRRRESNPRNVPAPYLDGFRAVFARIGMIPGG